VVLLLFVIGIEFSLKNLMKMKKAVLRGGGIQVLLAILLSTLFAYPILGGLKQSVFFGFLIALSSTAIVLKMLTERGEIDTPHGRTMVGILIFQDLIVVPLMLITPVLGGEGFDLLQLGVKVGKAAAIVVIVLLASRWIVPRMLHQVVHVRSRELFITAVILLCLGTALLTSRFGLSLALGAFLAGLVISESEYAHQAMSDILPFKDSFIGFFFVSVGMLMDLGYMANNWLKVSAEVGVILIIKVVAGATAAAAAGTPIRTALLTGLGLAQIGEFSFVLATAGRAAGLIAGEFYQVFLSASLVTMLLTPFVIKAAPDISAWAAARFFDKRLRRFVRTAERQPHPKSRSGHVVIVGFGLNGRNLARVLRQADIPYVVLEMNNDTVREMKKKGEPIYYGDGTSIEILHKIGIKDARILVVAISDAASTRNIVQAARRENPDLHIIVRTRYVAEVDDLKKLGANEVIPEEFETSIEIFSRVLDYFSLPRNVINDYIDAVRSDNYGVLRRMDLPRKHLAERLDVMEGIDTESYLIKEGSEITGQTIKDTRLRAETGVTVVAVQRDGKIHQNPSPDFTLKTGDILVLIGKRDQINRAREYLETVSFPEKK
jgi:CPA2 family monovalent cation:H+ antiporter-2